MTAPAPAPTSPPRRTWRRRRLLLLFSALLCGAGLFYWHRIHQPHVMLAQARSAALRNQREAEELAAAAIAQSAVSFPAAQLFHAQLLEGLGRRDEALGQFSLIDAPQQLSDKDLSDLARIAMSQRDTLLARKAFAAIPPASKLYPQARRSLIQIALEQGNDELVLSECRALLKREPTDATAWQILGAVAMDRKEPTEAAQALRQCLAYSDDADQIRSAREDLIEVLIDQGEAQQARAELARLRESDDELSERALIESAYLDRMEGNPQAGIATLEPLIERRTQDATQALYLRGLLHGDLGHDEQAAADLERVVAVQPWNKEAHHKLSVAYSRLGQADKSAAHRSTAENLTEKSLELLELTNQLARNPADETVRRRVTELYRLLGRPEEAARLAQP